jgi:hypothetical protein
MAVGSLYQRQNGKHLPKIRPTQTSLEYRGGQPTCSLAFGVDIAKDNQLVHLLVAEVIPTMVGIGVEEFILADKGRAQKVVRY